jgi:hypothetical protein
MTRPWWTVGRADRALIEAVHDESPDTKIGVTIAVDSDFNLDYYERVLEPTA